MFNFRFYPHPQQPPILKAWRQAMAKAKATGDQDTIRTLDGWVRFMQPEDVQ